MEEQKNKSVNLETMAGVGKKMKLAGREYIVLPVCIRDMHYILGEDINLEEGKSEKLLIISQEDIETKGLSWQYFGLNIVNPEKRKIFLDVINKYVYYLDKPMTEELLIEHNWSFKEIGKFLLFWCQEVSD